MYKYLLTSTLVIYKERPEILRMAIDSFLNTDLRIKLYLIDNSPTDILRNIILDERVEYIFNPINPGFGSGHNIGIKLVKFDSKYHLILNPDIYFKKGVIEQLIDFIEADEKKIGVLMPKILYPNGKIQYLAKLLPTPLDFIVRRVVPIPYIKKQKNKVFELHSSGYDKIMDVPFLSGCFLLFRTDVLQKVKGFDEKIFMYTEDIDICRRVNKLGYRSIFYPSTCVYHAHIEKPIVNFLTFMIYLNSAIYYFNKWGWFWDRERVMINKRTLKQINTF